MTDDEIIEAGQRVADRLTQAADALGGTDGLE